MVPGGLAGRLVASDRVSAVSKMEIWVREGKDSAPQRPGGIGREGAGVLGAGHHAPAAPQLRLPSAPSRVLRGLEEPLHAGAE